MYQSQHRDVWPDIDQENVTIIKLVLPASFILLWTLIKMTVGNWITSVIQHSVSMNEADLPVSLEAGSPGSLVFPVAVLPSVLSVHRCDMLSLVDSRVVKAQTSSISSVICIRWGDLIRTPPRTVWPLSRGICWNSRLQIEFTGWSPVFYSGWAAILLVNVHNYKMGSIAFTDREGCDVMGWRSIYTSDTSAGGVKLEYTDMKVRWYLRYIIHQQGWLIFS